MGQPTIFITIPAYEDPQLLDTIEGALDNALYPERLFFCIGMQYRVLPDISKYLSNPNFKFLFYDVDTRPGVYQIRKEMADEHSGQDYFMMIDSHMIFVKYWDSMLVNDYKNLVAAHGEKTVMSKPVTHKIGLTLNNGHINDYPCWQINRNVSPKEINRFLIPAVRNIPWNGDRFIKTYYACSHFFFTSKKFLEDLGFFSGIRFYCEELITSVLIYISGWDIYMNPSHILVGHDDKKTMRSLYNRDSYSLADGKTFTAIEDDGDTKLEIARFVLTGKSKLIDVNASRSVEDYYMVSGLADAYRELKVENLILD